MQTISSSPSRHAGRAVAAAVSPGGAAASSGKEDLDFSRMLSSLMETPAAEITPTLDVYTDWKPSESDGVLPAVSDPYAGRNDVEETFSGVSTLEEAVNVPVSDIRLTDTEIRQVADNLRRDGADAETVRRVEELAGHPGGASVAEVVRAVAREEPARLTEGDLSRIEALAGEIDPTGALGEAMLADLRGGQAGQAWASLGNALKELDPGTRLSVDRQQLLSLGKALRLGQNALSALDKAFGGADGLSLTPDGLKKLMAPAGRELADKAAARDKLVSSLEDAMKTVIRDARTRLEAEAQAGGRNSRRTGQSKTLIEDTVTRNSFARREGTAAEQARTARSAADSAGASGTPEENEARPAKSSETTFGKNGESVRDEKMNVREQAGDRPEPGRPGGDSAQHRIRPAAGGESGAGGAFDSRGGEARSGHGDAPESGGILDATAGTAGKAAAARGAEAGTPANPWEALLDRLNTAQAPGTVPLASAADAAKTAAPRTPSPYAGQVLSQVEKGMLSALSNGAKRLELQLNPVDLGAVNVLLTTKNGEVSALLRPERPETASLLMQQLGELRANLEQQGLKVDRVDVQTQLKDEQGMTWQGMDQHNAARDQRDRTLDLDRLRRLNRGTIAAGSPDGIPAGRLEAGAGGGRPASVGGLHLVA